MNTHRTTPFLQAAVWLFSATVALLVLLPTAHFLAHAFDGLSRLGGGS